MPVALRDGEVFQIACQVEHNGVIFYRQAAEMHGSSAVAGTLSALADWEEDHERTFAQMAREQGEPPHAPEDGRARALMGAVAGEKVFSLLDDPIEWLGEARSIDDILQKALQTEKDAIALYEGIREGMAAEGTGRDALTAIIEQEKDHVRLLGELLEGSDTSA
jgi:rubrerythrin